MHAQPVEGQNPAESLTPTFHLKRAFGLTLKIGLTGVISFIVLELLLLIFNDVVFRNSLWVYDPDLGYKVRPYFVWQGIPTNEFGFNDRDYPHRKAPGVFRILILGDSFNWAGGLEGNYAAILERKFVAEFGDQRVEIINAGYPGTHTGEQLELLKKFGLQYNPDLVVLGFFAGNDFFDAQPWRRRIVVGGVTTDIDTRKGSEIIFWGQPLVLKSRLYLFLQEQWLTYRYAQAASAAPSTPQLPTMPVASVKGVSLPTEWYLNLEKTRMQITNWAWLPEIQPREDYIFDKLLAMRDLLVGQDIKFVVVAYPDEFQVSEPLRQAVIDRFDLDVSTYQWDRPQGRLWQFCTDHQIKFYDMLPTFREARQPDQPLYLPNDSHWNEAGNDLAAQYLFNILLPKTQEHFGEQAVK